MKRNSDLETRFPAKYRHDIIQWRMNELGLEIVDVVKATGMLYNGVRSVVLGIATNKLAYPVAVFLGLDWKALHDFSLKKSEFDSAVVGTGKLGGSPATAMAGSLRGGA